MELEDRLKPANLKDNCWLMLYEADKDTPLVYVANATKIVNLAIRKAMRESKEMI